MMEALLVMIAMGLVLLGGAGLLLLIAKEEDRFGLAEFLAYSWLTGAVLVTMSQFLWGQVFSGDVLRIVVSIGCVALFLARARRLPEIVKAPSVPSGLVERVMLLGVVAQVGFFCWLAGRQYFGWDGLAVWEIKARAAFLNGGVPPAEFFSDPTRRWCHQAYPLFLPLLESWVYAWLGECNQFWTRFLFPPFYAAGVVVLASGVGRVSGKRLLGITAGILPFFVPFLMRRDGGVLSGYADFPLSVYYLAGVMQLLLFKRTGAGKHLWLFGVVCLGLPWVKDEGLILWVCLGFIGVWIFCSKLGWRMWIPALPGLVTVVGWSAFKHWVQAPPNRDILPMTPATLLAHLDRVGPLLHEVAREVFNLGHWSLLWVGVFLAVLFSVARLKSGQRDRLIASLAVAAPLAIYTSIYLFSAAPDYRVHFWTSYPRLLLQLAPTGILAMVLVAWSRGERAE